MCSCGARRNRLRPSEWLVLRSQRGDCRWAFEDPAGAVAGLEEVAELVFLLFAAVALVDGLSTAFAGVVDDLVVVDLGAGPGVLRLLVDGVGLGVSRSGGEEEARQRVGPPDVRLPVGPLVAQQPVGLPAAHPVSPAVVLVLFNEVDACVPLRARCPQLGPRCDAVDATCRPGRSARRRR